MEIDKVTVGVIAATLLLLGGIFVYATWRQKKEVSTPPGDVCVTHTGGGMHIHPQVDIYIENEKVTIPATIGITATCMRPVHTHDETGQIHIEFPQVRDFRLADFFSNWGQPFSKDQIMDKKVDDQHQLLMTVDGKTSEAFENLTMADHQRIEIRYEKK